MNDEANSAKLMFENNNQIKIYFPFKSQRLYSIMVGNDEFIQVTEFNNSHRSRKILCYSAYPNPSDGIMTIKVQLENNAFLNYEIYNLMGQQIYESPLIFNTSLLQSIKVDLSTYPSSLYFCKLNTSQSSQIIKLFLIK